MAKSVMALKYKGHVIPEGVIKTLIEANHSCSGAVCTIDKADLQVNGSVDPPTVEQIMGIQDALKDYGVLFTFAQVDGQPDVNDLQPHIILWDADNNPILSVALDGDFTEHADDKHPGEFNVAHDLLIPKMKALYTLAGGDLDKVLAMMNEEYFQKDLLRLGKDDTTLMTFVSVTGDFKTMAYDPKATRVMDVWGWHTKRWMAEAKKVVEHVAATATAPVSEVKAKPKLDFSKPKATVEPAKQPDKQPEVPDAPEKPEVPQTGDNLVTVGPPPQTLANKEKQAWWIKVIGYTPKDYKVATVTLDRNKIKDFKTLGTAMKAGTTVSKVEEETVHVDNAATMIPILSADIKAKIGTTFVKAHDNSATQIGDPVKIAEREAEAPSFADQTGIPMERQLKYSYEALVSLGKDVGVEALAVLCMGFRNELRDLEAATAPATSAKTDAPVAATSTKVKPKLDFGSKKVA